MKAGNHTKPQNVRDGAKRYIGKGWAVVPVHPRDKKPRGRQWEKQRISAGKVADCFSPDDNIGVLLGAPSGGLVDVDLDCNESVGLAATLLPTTGLISGRHGRPRSHYWFTALPVPEYRKFTDTEGKCLLEIRTNGQTVIPPSIHPTGERVKWYLTGEPARISGGKILAAAAMLAAATLVVRQYPEPGSRHDMILALAGAMLRNGWTQEAAEEFVKAVAVGAHDEESEERVNDVRTTVTKIRQGKAVTGIPKLADIVGAKVTDKLVDWLGLDKVGDTPIETVSASSWPEIDDAAFQGLAGDTVRLIEPETEADPVAILIQTLAAFGSAAGPQGPHYAFEASRHYSNIYCVLVGQTSKARKGTSFGHVSNIFSKADPDWFNGCIQAGLSSGEGLIHAVRDPAFKRKPGKDDDGTLKDEFVETDEGARDKRLLVVEEEFTAPLKIMAREGNTLSAIIRQAWDAKPLQVMNKNSPIRATGTHISIIGHVTKDDLTRYLDSTDAGNGFANRFLWACVKRSKVLPDGGKIDGAALDALIKRVDDALEFAKAIKQIRWTPEAHERWRQVYGELSEGKPGLVGAIIGRAEAQVVRLAMLYALMDKSARIYRKHLKAALAIWNYCEASANFIFGHKLGNPVADEILRALRGSSSGLSRTDISSLFGNHKSIGQIGSALMLLAEQGFASCKRQQTQGRPSEQWYFSGEAKKAKKAKSASS